MFCFEALVVMQKYMTEFVGEYFSCIKKSTNSIVVDAFSDNNTFRVFSNKRFAATHSVVIFYKKIEVWNYPQHINFEEFDYI